MPSNPKDTIDKLASLLDGAPYAVLICDTEGRMVFVNKVASQLYSQLHKSTSPKEWPLHAVALLDGKPLLTERYPLSRALRGESVAETELDIISHDTGKSFRIAVTAHPLVEEGRILGVMSIHRVISKL